MLQTRKMPVSVATLGGSLRSPPMQDERMRSGGDRQFGRTAPDDFHPESRWSPRATLAFGGGVSLLLWGAIGLAIYALR
jgi:hypothetical protein